MAGQKQIPLLRESLHSFARHSSRIPEVIVISDGTLSEENLSNSCSFWPGKIILMTPIEILEGIDDSLSGYIKKLIEGNILGLKLAAVIALSRKGPSLFMDADILWFSDPMPIIEPAFRQFSFAAIREDGCSVNQALALKYAPELASAPSVNTGLFLINSDISSDPIFRVMLQDAVDDFRHEFNEQTILGILSSLRGGYLSEKVCLVHFNDAFKFLSRKPWDEGYCSRHYVRFMRHQFYRDALNHRNAS